MEPEDMNATTQVQPRVQARGGKTGQGSRRDDGAGGPVPLGYDVVDRKLVINEAEAATVRLIFNRYLELGSVIATVEALNRDGARTKTAQNPESHRRGGVAWARGGLAHLLVNKVYIGKIRHKDQHFQGEHAPIVSTEVFEAVQAQLASNGVTRKHSQILRHANLLGGLLFDGLGRRMKSSQAAKGAKRYHYYETAGDAIVKTPGAAWRVPAHDTEALVLARVRAFLGDQFALRAATAAAAPDGRALEGIFLRAKALSDSLPDNPIAFRTFVRRIDLSDSRIDISVAIATLLKPVSSPTRDQAIDEMASDSMIHRISVPITKLRRGPEVRLVIAEPRGSDPELADPALLRLIAASRSAHAAMRAAGDQSVGEVAKSRGFTNNYFTLLLRLATLAPSIVEAIVQGRQPASLTRQRLAKVTNLPVDWSEQRRMLGFQ